MTDPTRTARRLARPTLPKRFYRLVEVVPRDGSLGIALDGRLLRTSAGAPILLPNEALAAALAAEWDAQDETIDAGAMPLTRIVNAALDHVAARADDVRAEIVRYAGSDLLCYRAEGPAGLAERQQVAWSPVLAWAARELGVRLVLAEGVRPVRQPAEELTRFEAALLDLPALPLAALHVLTTLTGSALLALATLHGHLTPQDAWAAAHIDEDWQIGQWGDDAEAADRRARRWREMSAAALILRQTWREQDGRNPPA